MAIKRDFSTRQNNILIDSEGRNAQMVLPVSNILITSVVTFTDLSGVTIVSYSGDQILSKSGNTIISSGTGFVFDLLLSDGTFIPFLDSGWDVSGNDNHAISIVDVSIGLDENGSTHLIDKGAVSREVDHVVNGDFTDGFNAWNTQGGAAFTVDTSNNNCEVTINTDGSLVVVQEGFNIEDGVEYELRVDLIEDSSSVDIIAFDQSTPICVLNLGVNSCKFIGTGTGILRIGAIFDPFVTGDSFIMDDIKLITTDIIPNNNEGQPILPLVAGDTFIPGTVFINETPFKARLFTSGDIATEYTFFDKSDVLIWSDSVRTSINYDPLDTGLYDSSELTQTSWDSGILPNQQYIGVFLEDRFYIRTPNAIRNSGYLINDKDLSDFGITVRKFSGWEIPANANGDLVFNNTGFNGVEYLENEVKGPKTLTLKCTMIGATIQELDQFYLDLFDWLYTPGVLLLSIDYMTQTFNTFFVDGVKSKKLTFESCTFDLKLRQYDIN